MNTEQAQGDGASRTTKAGPLAGVRVLDLTNALAGPFCTMLLGDQGADVIKIERPGKGDDTRSQPNPAVDGENTAFIATNRNKRSIELDLKSDSGIEIARELVSRADVFVQNLRPGKAEALGLGYQTLCELKPDIVYCAISGWGGDGPYAGKAGYASTAEALGGLMSVTGARNGQPVKVGVSIIDNLTGLYAKDAITSALYERTRSGKGQYLEVSLMESTISILSMAAYAYLLAGEVPERIGGEHAYVAPWNVFPTADGDIVVCAGNDSQWLKVCQAMNRDDWLTSPAFATGALRSQNRAQLYSAMSEVFRHQSTGTWVAKFDEAGAAVAPVNTIDKVFEDAQVLHRGMLQHVTHSRLGSIPQVGHAQKFSRTPCTIRLAPPVLGEHNKQILEELDTPASS